MKLKPDLERMKVPFAFNRQSPLIQLVQMSELHSGFMPAEIPSHFVMWAQHQHRLITRSASHPVHDKVRFRFAQSIIYLPCGK